MTNINTFTSNRLFRNILFLLPFVLFTTVNAQYFGEKIYSFVDVPNSARKAGLSENVSLSNEELCFAFQNPSLLDSIHEHKIYATWAPVANAGLNINLGAIGYAFRKNDLNFSIGTHFINYGSFDATDVNGNKYDKFNAGDYMLYIITSYNIAPKLNIGVSGKPIISALESYVSLGLLFDVGITFNDTAKLFSAGLVIKNFGFQIKPYTDTRESLPWSIDIGISKRLEHAPLRFHVTYCDLQKFDLQYDSEIEKSEINSFDDQSNSKSNLEIFASNLFRHFVIAGELILSKNIYGVVSYDIRKRNELAFDTRSGMSGFSLGVGLKLSKFHFSYSYSPYNIAASTHFISLESNLGNLFKGGKTKSISN